MLDAAKVRRSSCGTERRQKHSGSRMSPCADSDTQLMILSGKKDDLRLAGSISLELVLQSCYIM